MAMKETEAYIGEKLRPHLLSADFFDAAKYPDASFEITSVEAYTPTEGEASVIAGANARVSGNLKLRDQVKNISFPALITVQGGEVKAQASFDIDRTQWGMHYGNDQSLKDKFISPVVNISLALSAKG
jgi:polyisoprenoid-binding protein YceI